ncbi:hypothetical protein [Bradyrhizobium elkanii]|uniref:hypothetical protein n=1 Tax=Bradyrhizobium elkanii TaxID=29448 RepID=UPI0004B43995|nr:hypothetical protein [Bradyrhizobium elkanii]WLA85176.1 hypothetical protein QNJ99_13690 [Bradyrhizobium elkanii]
MESVALSVIPQTEAVPEGHASTLKLFRVEAEERELIGKPVTNKTEEELFAKMAAQRRAFATLVGVCRMAQVD